ncbi:MAG TPA: VOC family protein [Ilumatobacteraceae bacterium]|nr:VOC family protein [Ilumatobacteraceae bacterium]
MPKLAKITPWLWFDDEAEAAAKYYTGIFKKSKVLGTTYYSSAGPRPEGMVMTVSFELEGQQFVALNGGPEFTFDEAISFQVLCDSQKEVDDLWSKLSQGGQEGQCGWLKDKFGLSWQIVPSGLYEAIADPDPKRSAAATKALLGMKKIDLAEMQRAADKA